MITAVLMMTVATTPTAANPLSVEPVSFCDTACVEYRTTVSDSTDNGVSLELSPDLDRAPTILSMAAYQDQPADPPPAAPLAFGTEGTRRFYVHGGVGFDVKGNSEEGLLGVGWEYFLADDLSLSIELNGLVVNQDGRDSNPLGINFNLLLRYYFLQQDDWAWYIDGGAGMLGSTDDIPDNGSSFNFTPQAGIGTSIALENDRRLMIGVRWHHISNANTYENNPGRDSILGYIGVSMPF